jgi:hypothetical protein
MSNVGGRDFLELEKCSICFGGRPVKLQEMGAPMFDMLQLVVNMTHTQGGGSLMLECWLSA